MCWSVFTISSQRRHKASEGVETAHYFYINDKSLLKLMQQKKGGVVRWKTIRSEIPPCFSFYCLAAWKQTSLERWLVKTSQTTSGKRITLKCIIMLSFAHNFCTIMQITFLLKRDSVRGYSFSNLFTTVQNISRHCSPLFGEKHVSQITWSIGHAVYTPLIDGTSRFYFQRMWNCNELAIIWINPGSTCWNYYCLLFCKWDGS